MYFSPKRLILILAHHLTPIRPIKAGICIAVYTLVYVVLVGYVAGGGGVGGGGYPGVDLHPVGGVEGGVFIGGGAEVDLRIFEYGITVGIIGFAGDPGLKSIEVVICDGAGDP